MRVLLICFLFLSITISALAQNHRDKIDVVHYDITLDVSDFSQFIIKGNTEIIFQPIEEELQTVAFDLYSYTIDSIIFNGEKVENFNYNDTVFSFIPSSIIAIGQQDTCRVYYHGMPSLEPDYGWGGVHHGTSMIFNMGVAIRDVPHGFGRGWFPCIDNFTDKALYDIHLITKSEHRGIASGVLVEEAALGENQKVWSWKLNQSSPTYLVSFTAGEFTLNTIDYAGLTKSFPIEIYALQQDSTAAALTFADVPEMMSLYESLFGPYHWDKAGYTVVEFNSGAMEHITNIAYPNYALTTNLANQRLVAHELSHHWFGNLATCNNAANMWLNEGWARYCEALYLEHFHGKESYNNYVATKQRSVVNGAHNTDGGYWALNDIPLNITYSTTVYDKGAVVVHNLRHYMGDELFFPAVREYLETFSEGNASSVDLMNTLSEASGVDLTGFFNTWVFNGGFPQYMIDSVVTDGSNVTVGVSQQSVGRDYIGDMNKVEINFIDSDWNIISQPLLFDGQAGNQFFSLDFEPVMTILDLYNKTADAVFDHSKVLKSVSSYTPIGTNITVYPQVLTDSVFMHVAQMWKGPNEVGVSQNGVEPIDIGYWRISFAAEGDFSAKTRFLFNTIGLDDLGLTEEDSLVLIYRPDSRYPWTIPQHAFYGNIGSGSFILENLQLGDYAVAKYQGATNVLIPENKLKRVWPNPFIQGCYFELPIQQGVEITIYNMRGQIVDKLKTEQFSDQFFYDASGINSGVYFYEVANQDNLFYSGRIIKM
jgi:aminopeptidase N